MMWVRLDDRFHTNAKQLEMSDAAFRLYVCGLTYAGAQDQTGFISASRAAALLRIIRKGRKQIDELVRLRAWEPTNGGWQIHDFAEYAGPLSGAERTRRWRQRRGERDDAESQMRDDAESRRDEASSQPGDASRARAARPGPARPVPSRPVTPPYPPDGGDEGVEKNSNPRERGTNPRSTGSSSRQRGSNPRAIADAEREAELQAWVAREATP